MSTMPSEAPLVCAIMLVNGREKMVRRAVESFRAQTYSNAVLVIWDNGATRVPIEQKPFDRVWWWTGPKKSIGMMRNEVIQWGLDGPTPHPEIICHWDSDDHSHPQRISEQVALLQASGADCVGYREALFWDTRPGAFCGAWLYRDPVPTHCLGASMCYWRRTWERRPFADISHGEDARFTQGCKTLGVSGLQRADWPTEIEPRIICGIHGDRQSGNYELGKGSVWRRAEQWDAHCAERMKL